MQINKAYKLRIYPNKAQEERIWQIIHGCRFVWNHYLEERKNAYLERGENMNYYDCSKHLTGLKKQVGFEWLGDVSAVALQQSLRNLDVAFNRFFRRVARFPKFHSRKNSNHGFHIPYGPTRWKITGKYVQVEQQLVVKIHGNMPPFGARLKSLTVKNECGRWFAIILTEQEISPEPKTGPAIGIDLGLTDLIITSDGRRYENLRPCKSAQKRMKILQQSLSRKQKGSKRRERAKQLLASLHRKIANQRMNHLHQTTHRITSDNQAIIVCEDLSVKNMMCNHSLAGAIADASWGELVRQLEYKMLWRGGKLVKIGRFFPSSKTCSSCNHIVDKLPLHIRKWHCPKCGQEHDRDINAAKNILRHYKQPEETVGVESTQNNRRKSVRVSGSMKRRVGIIT